MATKKTNEEKLKELELRMEQLKAQKKTLLARQNQEQRKERTRRLIEIGAEVEAALGYELNTKELRKAFGDFIRLQESRGKFATKAIEQAVNSSEAISHNKELRNE